MEHAENVKRSAKQNSVSVQSHKLRSAATTLLVKISENLSLTMTTGVLHPRCITDLQIRVLDCT